MMEVATRVILFLLGTVAASIGIWLAAAGHTESAWACIPFVLVGWVFAFLSKFRRFKGFRLEAETWVDVQ